MAGRSQRRVNTSCSTANEPRAARLERPPYRRQGPKAVQVLQPVARQRRHGRGGQVPEVLGPSPDKMPGVQGGQERKRHRPGYVDVLWVPRHSLKEKRA